MGIVELTWEQELENNLGDFYLAIYKRSKIKGEATSWDFVAVDNTLPTVLVIGDSISRGYTTPLRTTLHGKANLLRAPENCGSARNGIKKLDFYTQGIGKIDVIVFNFGIHDRNSSPLKYEADLSEVAGKVVAKCSSAIFVSTTPFFPSLKYSGPGTAANIHAKFTNWYQYGRGMNEEQLNSIARFVSGRFGIRFLDIASAVGEDLVQNRKPNDVHFPEPYYAAIARPIAEEVQKILTSMPNIKLN